MTQNLPPFVSSKAFWEALAAVVAGLLALLAFFGVIDPSWAVPATVITTWVFALLRLFGVTPELRARDTEYRLARAEHLLEEAAILRNDLLGAKAAKNTAKYAKR